MGYYYDWLETRWKPKSGRMLTPGQRLRLNRRRELIDDLLTEIEQGDDAVARLYAQLLARTLCGADEELMREFGKRIAELSQDERVNNTTPDE